MPDPSNVVGTPPRRRRAPHHWRLAAGALAGLTLYFVSPWLGVSATLRVLVALNGGAMLYLFLTWRLFLTASSEEVRLQAGREDETPWGLLSLVIGAILASLAGIVQALMAAKRGAVVEQNWVAGLAVLTLVVSWLMLQTIFTLHYAHRHFVSVGDGDEVLGGFEFPGEPAQTYMDFVYLAFCMGATFQVSDTNVRRARLRNLITAHGAVAYLYNTAILALGINILSGLVGH